MKNFFLAIFCGLICLSASAQRAPIKYGDVSMNDLQMTSYDKDSTAVAVLLADYGESIISYSQNVGFQLSFERMARIKILKKEGFDWADFSIPVYRSETDQEKVASLKASTFNLEKGKIVETKVKNDAIFKEKVNENWETTKLTFPNVKEGSVLDISYKVISPFIFNFQDWQFQYDIPVVWSEYRARIPEYYNYDRYMQGYVSLVVNESSLTTASINFISTERDDLTGARSSTAEKITYEEQRYRWVAQNVPAFKAEPFITTSKDYLSKISFELAYSKFPNRPIKNYMGSWQDINDTYLTDENFGGQIKGNGFLSKIVEEITTGLTTDLEKIAAIDAFVKRSVSWDGLSRKYTNTPLKKVLEEKKGSSAEINFLLASMLEKANIPVYPVLISTRDNGFVREQIAISSQFNYVICMLEVNSMPILLDATDDLLPAGVIPERCLNGNGLLISKDGYKWIKLASPTKSRQVITATVAISKEGEMAGKLQFDKTGYYARNDRKKYLQKGEPDYVKDLVSNRSWQISKSEFANAKEVTLPFKENHDLTVTDHSTVAGDVIYLNPFLLARVEQNPFKLESRNYPVDFGSPSERMYMLKIKVPDGYAVDEAPQSKIFMLPENSARYIYNIAQAGDVLTLTSTLQINKNIFTQDEYPHLREFYNQIVAKESEQIVLKKK